jgi:glycosyltransferase involved in cell wall biosynthesis
MTPRLRCIQISNESFTAFKFLLPLAKHLKEHGIETDIACSDEEFSDARSFIKDIQAQGVVWRRLQIRRESAPLQDLAALFRAFFFFRKNRYDIVHTQTSKAGVICRIAARLAGVPLVVHYTYDYAFSENFSLKNMMYLWIEKLAARFCDRVYFIADAEMSRCFKYHIVPREKTLNTGPVGLDIREFDPALITSARQEAVRTRYGIPTGVRVAGTVSRLVPHKGVDTLIGALPDALARVPGSVCVVVGGGPQEEALHSQAKRLGVEKQVIFTGFVEEQADIPVLISLFDVFCLPTKKEGFGIVFAEAGALYKPAVGCDIAPVNTVIEHGVSGFLCTPDDPASFAAAIGRLLADPELCAVQGASGRWRAEHLFDGAVTYEKVRQDYLSLWKTKTGKNPLPIDDAESIRHTYGLQRSVPAEFEKSLNEF